MLAAFPRPLLSAGGQRLRNERGQHSGGSRFTCWSSSPLRWGDKLTGSSAHIIGRKGTYQGQQTMWCIQASYRCQWPQITGGAQRYVRAVCGKQAHEPPGRIRLGIHRLEPVLFSALGLIMLDDGNVREESHYGYGSVGAPQGL